MTGPSVPQRVGARVRAARKAADMTQAQLAARVGVTRGAISRLEAGGRDTTVTRLAAICEVLDLDLIDLSASGPARTAPAEAQRSTSPEAA